MVVLRETLQEGNQIGRRIGYGNGERNEGHDCPLSPRGGLEGPGTRTRETRVEGLTPTDRGTSEGVQGVGEGRESVSDPDRPGLLRW